MSKFIYRLTYILLKASITRNQMNQAPFIVVEPIIYLKVCLVITTSNESVSVMLLQTWHGLLLHLYEATVLSKG